MTKIFLQGYIQGHSKKGPQSWEIGSQEWLAAFEFNMKTDHCCLMTLSSGAAHSSKSTQLRDTKYIDV
jgi:hypothetical protein